MISIDTPSWYNQLHSSDFADPKNIRKNINFLARVIQQLSMEESKEFLVPVVADVRQALKTLTRLHNSPLGTRDISFLFSSIFHVRNTIKWSRRKLHKKGSDFTLKSLLSRKNDLIRQLLVSKRRHAETQNTISALMSQVTTLISEKKLAITKFQSVVKKVQTFSKGSLVPGSRTIDANYWIERREMALRIGETVYRGHFTPDTFLYREKRKLDAFLYNSSHDTNCLFKDEYDVEKSYIADWKNGKDQDEIPFLEQYSFEEYMNKVVIPSLSSEEKEALRNVCSRSVEYYTPRELKTLQAHVDAEGRIYTNTPYFNAWGNCLTKNEESYRSFLQREANLDNCDDVKRYYVSDMNPYIYVLLSDGSFYIQNKQKGTTQHSSLANGQAILSAGLFQLNRKGQLSRLLPHSGHYKPGVTQVMTMLEYLKKNKVKVNRIKIAKIIDFHEMRSSVGRLHVGSKSGKISGEVLRKTTRKWMREEKKALKQQIVERDPTIWLKSLEKKPYRELRELFGSVSDWVELSKEK